ncbi:hypothetical protein H2248_001875 [Termitomyces sp. 'cryptogamus']|nr:hypothetical protein H2248_001875 [Termitomyces sp. 'cryptogamus']
MHAPHSYAPDMSQDEVKVPHFIFEEEPLGIPTSEGCGFYQGGPGQLLGPKPGFRIVGKLGAGTTATLWLARDLRNDNFVAIKILSGYASQLNREEKLLELKILQLLSSDTTSQAPAPFVTKLLTCFYHPVGEDDGEHLCLVMDLLCSGIRSLLPSLPLQIVKRMLRHVLSGIAHAHMRGIAHTDLKLDNILITPSSSWSTHAIAEWLERNPPETYPPTPSLMGMVTVFVSKPLPDPTVDELATATFRIADWGHAQIVDKQTTDDITPLYLRPPEVILGGQWDQSVDIWTYGCLVFYTLTSTRLFEIKGHGEINKSDEEALLYQIICLCGENFQIDFLKRCYRIFDFFSLQGNLLKFKHYDYTPIQDRIRACGVALSTEEIEQAAAFMTRCLCLNPKDRPSAMQLLNDPWLN